MIENEKSDFEKRMAAIDRRHRLCLILLGVAILFYLLFPLIASAQIQPPKKQSIVPEKIEATGGKLLVIDASKAKGDVLFDWSKELEAIADGKKLYLTLPKYDDAKTYHVSVISWEDRTRDVVKINVPGNKVDPVDPPDPTKSILERLDKIEVNQATMVASQTAMIARIAALEQIKPMPPPVPADPFQAAVQAAWEKDGKQPLISVLASVYKLSGSIVNDPTLTTVKAIHDKMHSAAQIALQEQIGSVTVLPNVRRVLGDDANAIIGKTDRPADATARAAIAAVFLKHQKALEGVVR